MFETAKKVKLFNDIINGIDFIEQFLGSIKFFEEYTEDQKTKSAIERQLGIIGEAINRLKNIDPEELKPFQKDIIGFRNIIVHNYDSIDDSIVWAIIKEHLSSLKAEVGKRLETEQ
jgi:uncharacterized protein with HEPN domain